MARILFPEIADSQRYLDDAFARLLNSDIAVDPQHKTFSKKFGFILSPNSEHIEQTNEFTAISRTNSICFRTIQEFHRQQIITYFPAIDDVRPVLHQADVVVLPSEYNEGVPACLLEAMACGKPIITTNWKGCKETVDHGKNGLLIEKGSVEALKNAMLQCLAADGDVLDRMGKARREKVEREFDEQYIVRKYIREIVWVTEVKKPIV